MTMTNAYDPGAADALPARDRDLIARRERLLGPAYRLFYANPVHLVRGEGVWLHGPEGERYLDAYNNVACVGHCHPHVVAALASQAAVLNTHTRYLNDTVLDYAERLLGYFPKGLGNVIFTCTGSEANDLALRVARAHTGGTGVIVTNFAYHGVTAALAELSPSLGPAMTPGAHVRMVAAPESAPRDGQDVGAAFEAGVRAAIADLQAKGIRPAALLVDTIFSSDGVFADPPGFLSGAVAAIREAGGLFIADEVQPGFGRTGAGMWGFSRHGVLPDMVSLGKPMGNGHPMAGLVARPEVLERFGRQMRYFNTFGGNTVAIAAAQATFDVIRDDRLQENAARIGAMIQDGLREIAQEDGRIGYVRGAGRYIGVEFVKDRDGKEPDSATALAVVDGLRQRRVLISATGHHANTLKIRPPLVFSESDVDRLLTETRNTLAAI